MNTPLTCRETTYLVISARDEPLDRAQQDALAAHLQTCSYCRTASAQFSALFTQLDALLARDVQP
jgi:predicted anti-sigma-YlaC factor YlaD